MENHMTPTRAGLRVAVKQDDGTAIARSPISDVELETVMLEPAQGFAGGSALLVPLGLDRHS